MAEDEKAIFFFQGEIFGKKSDDQEADYVGRESSSNELDSSY